MSGALYTDASGLIRTDADGLAHTDACEPPACCGETQYLLATSCQFGVEMYVRALAVCAGGGSLAGATILYQGECWEVGATPIDAGDIPGGSTVVEDAGFVCAPTGCEDEICFPPPLCCVGGLTGMCRTTVNGVVIPDLDDENFGTHPTFDESESIRLRYLAEWPDGYLEITIEGRLDASWIKDSDDPNDPACRHDRLRSHAGTITTTWEYKADAATPLDSGSGTVTIDDTETDLTVSGSTPCGLVSLTQAAGTGAGIDIEWLGTVGSDTLSSTGLLPLKASEAKTLTLDGFLVAGKSDSCLPSIGGVLVTGPASGFFPIAGTAGENTVAAGSVVYSASRRQSAVSLRVTVSTNYAASVFDHTELEISFNYAGRMGGEADGICVTQPPGSVFLLATECGASGRSIYIPAEAVCVGDGLSAAGRVIYWLDSCWEVGETEFDYDEISREIPVWDNTAFLCAASGCETPDCPEGECCEALLEGCYVAVVDDVDFAAQAVMPVGSAPILRERYTLTLSCVQTGVNFNPALNPELYVTMDFEYLAAVDPLTGTCDAEVVTVLSDYANFAGVTQDGDAFDQNFVLDRSALGLKTVTGRLVPPFLDVHNTDAELDGWPTTPLQQQGFSLSMGWGGTRGIWTLAPMPQTPLLPRARRSGGAFGAHTFRSDFVNGPLTPWLVNSNIGLSYSVFADVGGSLVESTGFAYCASNFGSNRSGSAEAWCRYSATGLKSASELELVSSMTTPGATSRTEAVTIRLFHSSEIVREGACTPAAALLAGSPTPETASLLGRLSRASGAKRMIGFARRPG